MIRYDDTERLLDEEDIVRRHRKGEGDPNVLTPCMQLEKGVEKMTVRETLQLSSYFCILWFLANYCTNASLAYTTVGSSTILSSMSGK